MTGLIDPGPIEFDAEVLGEGGGTWVDVPLNLKQTYGKGNLVPINAIFNGTTPYQGVLAMMVSGVLHTGYFVLLQRGYREGDLSLVYPLARGTGPTLSTLAAVVFFGERPSPVAFAGAMLIGVGVFLLAGARARPAAEAHRTSSGVRAAVMYGLVTGVFIAGEMLDWDAPTGGYLLQACFATGVAAARAVLDKLQAMATERR